MKKYEGKYESFDKPVWSNSLLQLQEHIENSGGYGGNPEECNFIDYESAWIYEYNIIGRHIASYYFSILDKKWHRLELDISNWMSWNKAVFPFKQIAQWYLEFFGYRKIQIDSMKKFVQKKDIDRLYGR